jgi:chromate transporter
MKKYFKRACRIIFKTRIIGFGGPAVHIAMMQNEVVVRKKWMSEQHFRFSGATNLSRTK